MINWKLRFKNKVILTALIAQLVAIVYTVLGMAGIVPAVEENAVLSLAYMVIETLCLMGIVVDPTTQGIKDSEQAQSYAEPR